MIELRCLGSIDIRSTERGPATRVVAQPKRYALLAYLALASPRGFHRRDTLIALFWPEADDDHARSGLRIALSFLRHELGDNVIITRGDDVAVNREVVRSDVDDFESAFRAGDLEHALSLYGGNLLPGLHVSTSPEFDRWLEGERNRLRGSAHDAALELGARYQAGGDAKSAIKWLRFALDLTPDDEAVVQRLIQAFDNSGDRAGALRAYEAFAERMVKEFDSEPSPETRALVAGMRARSSASANFEIHDEDRTVHPTSGETTHDAVAQPPVAKGREVERSRHARLWTALTVAGLVALIGGLSVGAVLWRRQPQSENTRPRVAVVTLRNQTGRSDLDHVGGMVADQIARDIGERGVGDVVTLAALPPTKPGGAAAADPVGAVAKETGARVVITGGYTIEGDTLLVRVEVADAAKERLLAVVGPVSAAVARPSAGITIVSSQVLSSIARVVEPRLSRYIAQKGWSRPTPMDGYRASTEGFELFLAAQSRENYERAIDRFALAYSLDSTEINSLFEMAIIEQSLEQWARADSLLTRTNASRGRMSVLEKDFLDLLRARNAGDHRAAYEFARDAMERLPGVVWEYTAGYHALSAGRPRQAAALMTGLNPDEGFFKGVWGYRGIMAEAHHVLGEHLPEIELARLERKKHPQLLSTALYEARALAALGRMSELRAVIDESESLPPQSGLIPGLPPLRGLSPGSIMIEAGLELRAHGHPIESRAMLERAIAWYGSRLRAGPPTQLLQEGFAESLYAAGRWPEAEKAFGILARDDSGNVEYEGHLALIAARQGRRANAVAAADRLAKVNEPYLFGRATMWRARLATQLGDPRTAIALLRQSLTEGTPFGIAIHRDIDLEPLRAAPSFREFVRPRT